MSGMQNHITINFPMKSPADGKAIKEELPPLMPDFAKVQDALGYVHYSRFLPWQDQSLLFLADIDGEVEKFYEDLAKSAGPVFDTIFKHVVNPPTTPVAGNSDAFIQWVKHNSSHPLIGYTAYEGSSVQDVKSSARAAGFTGTTEQRPLLLPLPLKSSLGAFTLEHIVVEATESRMRKGADTVGTLHFAHFVALPGNYLGFFTVYDGTFEKYMQDFTQKIGPIFDVLYKFVTNAPPLPVAKNSEAFTKYVAAAEYPPIGFYSAYPGLAVQDIKALLADAKAGAA
ncbi:MAG TPA: hypothetical protein VK813_05300 [Edaphobacter sp.]|jgi:hypothetical protein|nr:hypothetical protein [Edaphobacter sp.]